MAKKYVQHADDVRKVAVPAGTATTMQVLISADQGPHFAMRRFHIQPGGGMPAHTNEVEHEQYVLAGRATIGIAAQTHPVQAGDVVHIPARVPHWYRNDDRTPFVFLCLVPNQHDEIKLVK